MKLLALFDRILSKVSLTSWVYRSANHAQRMDLAEFVILWLHKTWKIFYAEILIPMLNSHGDIIIS